MTAPVFLADLTGAAAGTTLRLDGAEGRHAAMVRRLSPGESIDLTDGAGGWARGSVSLAGKDFLDVAVADVSHLPRPQPQLTVVQALPKGDRGELAVDLMTEVGVDTVVPWAAARCVTRWTGERGDKALRKWQAHAVEAGKQSRRAWAAHVAGLATTDEVAGLLADADLAVVLHESAPGSLAPQAIPSFGSVVLVVGPEGGITEDELETFTQAGAIACRMGPTVLRTSSAGVAAAAVVLAAAGRWS